MRKYQCSIERAITSNFREIRRLENVILKGGKALEHELYEISRRRSIEKTAKELWGDSKTQ